MMKKLKNNTMLLIFLGLALLVLLMSIYVGSMVAELSSMLEYNIRERLVAISKSAAQLVAAEELSQFRTVADMEKPEYQEVRERLLAFAEDSDVLFVYYLRPEKGMLQFVIDSDPDPESQVGLHSEPLEYEPAPIQALQGEAVCSELGDYSENWSGILAAYAPVYDSDGNVYCIAGVDISDAEIVNIRSNVQFLTMLMIVVLSIVIVCGFVGFSIYRKKAESAQSASRAKSQFLSRMSHEIRTPLNAIIGLSRMALETDDTAAVSDYLGSIRSSSGQLLRLVEDVLDFSLFDTGGVTSHIAPSRLRGDMEELRGTLLPLAAEKGQHFALHMDETLPEYIIYDAPHMKRALLNLLSNAVKFTPEGGKITLSVDSLGQDGRRCHLVWRVKDNGIGIDPRFLPNLFDPFEQGDGSNSRQYGGTGLGLSISRQLADMMGGQLSVDSVPGKGSEFSLRLWVQRSEVPAPDPSATRTLEGEVVLLAEDSEINRLIAENILSSLGATVESAENGLAAYALFRQNPQRYSYIFMDIQMPEMDGIEVTEKIRRSGLPGAQEVPIIAMTANTSNEDVSACIRAGMNAHVAKPIDAGQIESAVARAKAR